MMIFEREDWISDVPWDHTINGKGKFYVCPPFRGWSAIRDVVIHYPGADFADMDFNNDGKEDLNDTRYIIQNMHKAYLKGSRGYSLGYGFGIGQGGDIWEIRGWEYTNAANLGQANMGTTGWNNYSISILIIVDEQKFATEKQVTSVNWLLDELGRRKATGPLMLKYHGMGQQTDCCGRGIIDQIKTGVIAFGKSKDPIIVQPPAKPKFTVTPGRKKMDILFEYGEGSSWYHALRWGCFGMEHVKSGVTVQTMKDAGCSVVSVDSKTPGAGDTYLTEMIKDIGSYGPSPYYPGSSCENSSLHATWLENSNGGV